MKSLFHGLLFAAAGLTFTGVAADCSAQSPPPYAQQAYFQQSAAAAVGQVAQAYPASPLAGGPAAAQGDSFVDVYGNPIVLPVNYCQDGYCGGDFGGQCYGGDCYGGDCYGGGGACGDGSGDAWASFGGCPPDQCGPHYFDVEAGVVYLQSDDLFTNVGPLGSIGVDGPRILDPSADSSDYEPGWEIAFRLDFGPLSVLEATYMGIYDFGFNDVVNSVDVAPGGQDFQLFAPPGFGQPAPIPGIDFGQTYSVRYESDLQSTEFSYRRYWVGHSPRVSGTYLLGFRYVRMTEEFDWTTVSLDDPALQTTATSTQFWASENDLLGFQCGGDGWICLLQGLRIGGEGKAGIYNNRYKLHQSGSFAPISGAPADYDVDTEGNHVAFVGEARVSVVADIFPSWSIRGGYRVLYLDRLATVGNTIDTNSYAATVVNDDADALYHGFDAGLEYIW